VVSQVFCLQAQPNWSPCCPPPPFPSKGNRELLCQSPLIKHNKDKGQRAKQIPECLRVLRWEGGKGHFAYAAVETKVRAICGLFYQVPFT
jgi:hypothetical protein